MSLHQYFSEQFNSEQLNKFIKLCIAVLGKQERLTRKDERALFLAKTLQNPQSLRQLWGAMDGLARKAVAAAYHNEGEFIADAFVAQYGKLPLRPKKSQWSYTPEPILMDLFIQRGHIPPELMPLLKGLVPPPERFQIGGVKELKARIDIGDLKPVELRRVETEQAGWHDLLLLLQLADQHALKFSSTNNKLTPGSVPTLLDQLLQGDFLSPTDLETDGGRAKAGAAQGEKMGGKLKVEDTIRPFGLITFAKGAGLMTTVYGAARVTESGRALLNSQEPALLLEAFENWTKGSAFDEITRIQAIKGFKSHGLRLTSPAMRRERIVEALSWCPAGVWIDIATFYRGLKVWRFDFEVEQGGIEKLHVGYRYSGSGYYEPWADSNNMWLLINGLYINAVLWEYLATIGALDIAYLPPSEANFEAAPFYGYEEEYYSRYDGLFYFRINPLGAYLFGQAGEYQRPKSEGVPLFQLGADRLVTVLDPARLTPVLKTQLEQVAAPQGEAAYQLDARKLLPALEQGFDLQNLRDFLARNSAGSLPPEVNRWLDELHQASSAFTVEPPLVRIRAASEELVQLVLGDAELGKFCQSLGNRTLVMPSSRQARFRTRLHQLGYGIRES